MPFEVSNLRNIRNQPSFNLGRTKLVAGGKLNQPDPVVESIVKSLEEFLGRRYFDDNQQLPYDSTKVAKANTEKESIETAKTVENESIQTLLALNLAAIVARLREVAPDTSLNTFRDIILADSNTALLFEVKQLLKEQNPGFNSSYLLKHENIVDFLFCSAVYAKGFEEAESIAHFMLETEEGGGTKMLYDFIIDKGVDKIANEIHLETTSDTLDGIKQKFSKKTISFASGVFSETIKNELNAQVFDYDELSILKKAESDLKITIHPEEKPALVNFIRSSKGEVNKDNINYMLPLALTQIRANDFKVSTTANTSLSDSDFSVTYYEDDNAALVVNRENILCAAQVYYVMTLADEMEIFNVANRIITKHFNSVGIKIPSKESHNMLKLYLFGDSFKDSRDGNTYKRTVPQERWLVYKGLFDAGDAQVLEGMTVNSEFNEHWEVLMSEVVKYLDKAERSENPEYYISRQNIMQAIEDLQYNLSSFCTTMAKIAGPVINAELDFVMKEILQNPEVTLRLAPDGSNSVWKVVEHELAYMRQGAVPNVKALYDKARYGDAIIRAIANYSPTQFEETFSDFLGIVEAFIIANSKLEMMQEDPRNSMMPDEQEEMPVPGANGGFGGNGYGRNYPPANGQMNGQSPKDDWNF